MSTYASQLEEEQRAVSRAYNRLDALREETKHRLDAVRAAGSHGSPTQRTERDSFATMYEDRLIQLRGVEDRLVFGRLDDSKGDRLYIGRIGLTDERHNPMLIDWRAEAARPFYEATPSHHGDIVMRRHITLHFRDVVALEDEVLDVHSKSVDEASTSGTLTGEGALLASLSSRRTGKMTDIVATIQGEQDKIIRSDIGRAVVVQGGPGTGKTAVALHRAAYLLYTHRRTLSRSGVLVVGPSPAFLHYIDQVLPSLGETGVVSRTIADLIPGVMATAVDTPQVAYLKGERRMANAIRNAVADRERIPSNLPVVHINGIDVPMLPADIEQALGDARRTHQPHNKARETFVKSMLSAMRMRYEEQLDYTPDQDELYRTVSLLRMNDKVRVTLNLAWLPMTGQWLLDDMFSKPHKLRRYAPWLSDEQVKALTRPKGS
ncbi:MAG: ATP-dependent DNA helicase, partial [Bifidobacterium merycicum]|nr:ATP-dependent DNA helicase [Bifidobacterium merycicum]